MNNVLEAIFVICFTVGFIKIAIIVCGFIDSMVKAYKE